MRFRHSEDTQTKATVVDKENLHSWVFWVDIEGFSELYAPTGVGVSPQQARALNLLMGLMSDLFQIGEMRRTVEVD